MYYTGNNAALFKEPDMFVSALLESLKAERASKLLEDLMEARCNRVVDASAYLSVVHGGYFKPSPTDYRLEEEVNRKAGFSLLDLIVALETHTLVSGEGKTFLYDSGRSRE